MGVFSYILYILLAIAILLLMILIHEFGHYIAGRILKFKITEFSIGFGKAIFSWKNKRGELISLRIIPLGGYCAFAGEEDATTEQDIKEISQKGKKKQRMVYNEKDGLFVNFAPWKRLIVFFAGVFMNFITAIVFSLILLCSVGGLDVVQVKGIEATSAVTQVLEKNDVILKLDNQKIDIAYGVDYGTALQNVVNEAKKLADPLDYRFSAELKRDGSLILLEDLRLYEVFLDTNEDGVVDANDEIRYNLGVELKYYVHTFWEAFLRCVSYAFGLAWMVLKSFWLLITFQLPISAIGGPITTIATMATVTQANIGNLLMLIPLISANLAVFNLLPFPALDGSRMVFTSIEWFRGRPVNRNVENTIHFVGIIVLFAFVILVDILHFIL